MGKIDKLEAQEGWKHIPKDSLHIEGVNRDEECTIIRTQSLKNS